MVVYGGVGQAVLDDLCVLDGETCQWRNVSTQAATSKDRPEKVLSHAAAAVGNHMWMFGGQQGRSFLRKLYSLDLTTYSWRKYSSDSLPSARAGHAMVTVQNVVYLFGGQGKKLMNDMYRLDTNSGEFSEVKAVGRLPTPRRGMSLVYDGRDSLICFGGMHSGGMDNSLSVFSLSRSEWYAPQQLGAIPTPRTNHSAVLLRPHLVLLFGGCNAQGAFFNDAYVLDTRNWTWSKPQLLNTAPAPRYHHSCCVVNGRIIVYGGINAKQTFDGVVTFDFKFNNEISHIAEELQSLVTTSNQNIPSVAATPRDTSAPLDMMKLQLTDLLYKRNMEELHAQATRKVAATEQLLNKEREMTEALTKEVNQLQLLAAEADDAASVARDRAREVEAKAARDAGALSALRTTHDATVERLRQKEAELADARKQHLGLIKELSIMSSRFSQLRASVQRRRSARQRQAASTALLQDQALMYHAESLPSSDDDDDEGPSPSSSAPQDPSSAAMNDPGLDLSQFNLLAHVGELEQQRAQLEACNQQLQEQLEAEREKCRRQCQELDMLQAAPHALEALSLLQLQQLESRMDAASRTVREALMQRTIMEATRKASCEQQQCSVCLEAPRSVVFNCGHQTCDGCSAKIPVCPFCRVTITTKIRLFDV
eukprot:CAMPEP_0202893872 /NCGR_PEP_ID=MMETSP1392-20130828/3368_1 /ASSEMBLY_ACC=CAM_ASM_000868 /TAXON_ID=225041 /ORGANISM="Chlamydomonas chlamydogama, Strain SAG 11-48b" /LENGTH=651 /DNA_ID=CAMNT_0049578361 /DNA_START=173 /DNA_END=2128 /DNA_ORIENTATION=+